MVFIRKKHHHFQAKVRVPLHLRPAHGGKEFLYLTLPTSDSRAAKARAEEWEAQLRLEWLGLSPADASPRPLPDLTPLQARALYQEVLRQAEEGQYHLEADGEDPLEAGIAYEIEKIADRHGDVDELPRVDEVRLWALNDASASARGRSTPPRRELEASFRDLADDYMTTWRAKPGLKATNTEQQMLATFDLFAGYFGVKPIRQIREADAAHFVDALRQMHPNWARKPKARKMTWTELQKAYGGQPKGLADATVNRHMATLKTFWKWAKRRGHCEGENPFEGHHRTLKEGINARGYVAWTDDELKHLFSPPPNRDDLTEIMLVALYSGMRLDEIASLTVGDIHRKPLPFIRVNNAKTPAGNRNVPIHPALQWLLGKADGKPEDRLWPKFRDEGPGSKPGGDAGKEFSRHKAGKGYNDRIKAFHSFRKNFVGQLEQRRVPEQEVAQIVGHEKAGFTFGTYGSTSELARKAEVVAMVEYHELPVPEAYRQEVAMNE